MEGRGSQGQMSQVISLAKDMYDNVLQGDPHEAFVTEAEGNIEFRYRENENSPMMYKAVDKEDLKEAIPTLMDPGEESTYESFHESLEEEFPDQEIPRKTPNGTNIIIYETTNDPEQEIWVESDTYWNLEQRR